MDWKALNKEIGNIDLYWLDFILKGHLPEGAKILDAGCGEGRNLQYCFKNSMDLFAVDQNREAIEFLKRIAKQYSVPDIEARIQLMKLDNLRFPDSVFDVVICCAVLHFAKSTVQFSQIVGELIRVLKPGGKILIRTMTDRYIPQSIRKLHDKLYQFTEDEIWFLTGADVFVKNLHEMGLQLLEPYKEVVVDKHHSMGNFVLQKS